MTFWRISCLIFSRFLLSTRPFNELNRTMIHLISLSIFSIILSSTLFFLSFFSILIKISLSKYSLNIFNHNYIGIRISFFPKYKSLFKLYLPIDIKNLKSKFFLIWLKVKVKFFENIFNGNSYTKSNFFSIYLNIIYIIQLCLF